MTIIDEFGEVPIKHVAVGSHGLPEFIEPPTPRPSWFTGILAEQREADRSSQAWRTVLRGFELGYPEGMTLSLLFECPLFLQKFQGRLESQADELLAKARARHPHMGLDCWDSPDPTEYCLEVTKHDEPNYAYKYVNLRLNSGKHEAEPIEAEGTELDEFLAEDEPEYDWLIPGLLEREERLILTGGEGNGKSTLMRQFGIQCASGIHPISREPMNPVKVLMVDLENPRRIIRRKMTELRKIAGTSYVVGNFHIVPKPDGLDLATQVDADWLGQLVGHHKPDLLLIGPLYKMSDEDLTDNKASKDISNVLDQVRVYCHCALMIEAHLRHASAGEAQPIRPYGASLWKRWPEFGLYLGPDGAIKHWRNPRDERPWPDALMRGKLDKGDWPWMIGKGADEVATSVTDGLRRLENAEKELIEIVAKHPGLKTGPLTEKLKDATGITASAELSQIIQTAADLGKIIRIKRGHALLHFLPGIM